MIYDWNFGRLGPYWHAFVAGTWVTVALTCLAIVIGTLLGLGLGLLIRDRIMRAVVYPALDVVRAIPPLVLLLFFYYLLSVQVIGTVVTAFWVCVIGLSLNLAAFIADLVRAAIENVSPRDLDAGRALGLSESQLTRHIVLPSVVRELVPSLTVLYIGTLKMTSLASVINVREIVYTASTVTAEISRSLEAWGVVAAIYCVLVIPTTYLARRIEKRLGRGRSNLQRPV
jgi:polar amino acid transport system permease protein